MFEVIKKSRYPLMAGLFMLTSAAHSVEGNGFSAGGKLDINHDDNIYRSPKQDRLSDNYLSFSPSLNYLKLYGKHFINVNYEGDYARYSSHDEADYEDHILTGLIHFEHINKVASEFEFGYLKDHEEPGSINRIQLGMREYNLYEQNYYKGSVIVGSDESIGKIDLSYKYSDTDYKNNSLEFLSNEENAFSSIFTYRAANKIRTYLFADHRSIDYERLREFQLDNVVYRLQGGAQWNYSEKLTGSVFVGYQNRDYESDSFEDISGLAYEFNLDWGINTYTELSFLADRESIDSSLEDSGGFVRNSYGLVLTHEITPALKINSELQYAKDELVNASSRVDKRKRLKVGISYEYFKNYLLTLNYGYEDRDSTLELAEFTANLISLELEVKLGE